MKQLKLISSLIILTVFFGCDKIDELTQFNIDYNEEVVIESSVVADLPFNIYTPEINSNSESTFESNNTNKDLIEYIELRSLTLEVKQPENGNFNFLNSVDIYISADGLDEVKIAWKEDIPADSSRTLTLDTSNDDLKEFIKKDNFSLRIETVTDELLTSDHHIEVKTRFFVDAKILGI